MGKGTEHTPTPWITDHSHGFEWDGIAIWSGDSVIAHVVPDNHDQAEGNAQLIIDSVNERDKLKAINAELLEALKGAYDVLEVVDALRFGTGEDVAIGQIIQDAIAKAEGAEK